MKLKYSKIKSKLKNNKFLSYKKQYTQKEMIFWIEIK